MSVGQELVEALHGGPLTHRRTSRASLFRGLQSRSAHSSRQQKRYSKEARSPDVLHLSCEGVSLTCTSIWPLTLPSPSPSHPAYTCSRPVPSADRHRRLPTELHHHVPGQPGHCRVLQRRVLQWRVQEPGIHQRPVLRYPGQHSPRRSTVPAVPMPQRCSRRQCTCKTAPAGRPACR
jgi:hypothetical protein